jgi:translation initiation factor 4A
MNKIDKITQKKTDINEMPELLDQKLVEKDKSEITQIDSFDDMTINENILRGIYSYGFEKPSRIQSLAIKPIVDGRDVIAQSQSGTGKTGAFAIGTLSRIDESTKIPQAIIMCNTHELATQIHSVISELSKFTKIEIVLCIGGVPISQNIQSASSSHILIGTPGRLKDLIERKAFNMSLVKLFVIDEADELLTNEFLEQTKTIIAPLATTTQMCIFSATLPKEVVSLTSHFMTNPVTLLIQQEKLTLDLITQFYINVKEDKYKAITLEDLYSKLSINQCIIYVNSKSKAEMLCDFLHERRHEVETIHSGLDHKTRLDVMKRFRKAEFRVLISTDLMCRGIDVQQVSYVINYDIPYDTSSYLHRIGRSGRYGKKGVAINFMTDKDYGTLNRIRYHYNTKIESMPDTEFLNNYLTAC